MNNFRCTDTDCKRIFAQCEATTHTYGNWSEAHGQRGYMRTEVLTCPYCACAELDDISLCRDCKEEEAEPGCDQCSRCIEMEEADWKERKARYDANEPDCERARKALVTV